MKNVLIVLLILGSGVAWGQPSPPAGNSADGRPPWILSARMETLFSSIDPEVDSQWDHDQWGSYSFSLAGYYSMPQAWRQIYFFFGLETARFTSTERIEAAGRSSKIVTTMTQLLIKGGAIYQPDFLGGRWSGFATTGVEVWGERESKLTTQSFSRGLGIDKTEMPLVLGLGAMYAITPNWMPLALVESRIDGFTQFALGLNYAF